MFDVIYPPVPDALSQPFWDALPERRLMIQRHPVTGQHQWYPRAHALNDPTVSAEWVQASGTGRVFSHTTIYRGGVQKAPYTCVLVELTEGPLMLARWRTDETTEPQIDMAVQVDFEQVSDGLTLPVFFPQET